MGAFPSHDAPELIYTTMVSHPTNESQVEVCLVPLLPRFFNDGHKKVKKKLNDLLVRKGSSPAPGAAMLSSAKRGDQGGNSAIVDYIISGTEAFFFVNTKDAVHKREDDPREKPMPIGLGGDGTESATLPSAALVPPPLLHQSTIPMARIAPHSGPAIIRPVPFAVCILDPDVTHEGSGGHPHGGKQHHFHGGGPNNNSNNNGNIVVIKGRRVLLVGFIACCMSKKVHHIHMPTGNKGHGANGSTTGAVGSSSLSLSTVDGKRPIPVVLDVIFDDKSKHGYLTESVVLLASFAFRKQFVNSCALYYPAGDEEVESAFNRYMERLQLSMIIRHDDHRGLRMFYTHYPLLEMISDLRSKSSTPTARFSFYENHQGEHGIEMTFNKDFLGSWFRYIEKLMRVDSVNGYHVRCIAGNILQERDRLLQERQDSGAFLEEDEEESNFGGALYVTAMKRWLAAASHTALKHPLPPVAAPMMMFPAPGYWPAQVPMMVGDPSAWGPGGVLPAYGAAPPIAVQQPGIVGQPPQFVCIPTPGPQMYANAPAFMPAAGGMPMVAQPNAFPLAAPPGVAPQQFVYVLPPGAQMPQQPAAQQVFLSPPAAPFPAFHPYAGFQPAAAPPPPPPPPPPQ